MHQVMNFMEEKIMPPLFKMASNKYLLAIRDAFTSTLAIVLIGSVFLLICYFPNESWAEFIGPYVPMLSVPNTLTLGLIALYMAFAKMCIRDRAGPGQTFHPESAGTAAAALPAGRYDVLSRRPLDILV